MGFLGANCNICGDRFLFHTALMPNIPQICKPCLVKQQQMTTQTLSLMKTERFGLLPTWLAKLLGVINTYEVINSGNDIIYKPLFGKRFGLWSKPISDKAVRYWNGREFVMSDDISILPDDLRAAIQASDGWQ